MTVFDSLICFKMKFEFEIALANILLINSLLLASLGNQVVYFTTFLVSIFQSNPTIQNYQAKLQLNV